ELCQSLSQITPSEAACNCGVGAPDWDRRLLGKQFVNRDVKDSRQCRDGCVGDCAAPSFPTGQHIARDWMTSLLEFFGEIALRPMTFLAQAANLRTDHVSWFHGSMDRALPSPRIPSTRANSANCCSFTGPRALSIRWMVCQLMRPTSWRSARPRLAAVHLW